MIGFWSVRAGGYLLQMSGGRPVAGLGHHTDFGDPAEPDQLRYSFGVCVETVDGIAFHGFELGEPGLVLPAAEVQVCQP